MTDGMEADEVSEAIGLPQNHWLADAVADALETGDALYLLHQCRKHLSPRIDA